MVRRSLASAAAFLPAAFLPAAFLLSACAPGNTEPGLETYAFRGATMGTYYAVKIAGEGLSRERLGELQAMIEGELEEVDSKMSTYIDDSELSRFNRYRKTTPFPVSPATLEVVSAALEIARLTGGAYDVTIGPLVNAWGFGAGANLLDLSDQDIRRLVDSVGYTWLEADPAASALRKLRPDLYCDLSSIAKGYAVDRVSEALAAAGFAGVWVEVGGEVRAAGRNAEDRVWRLGIERPELETGAPALGGRAGNLQRILPLSDAAVATSGDYRNYRERDGARISHIIDPRSGMPVGHRLASVSVVHRRCTIADALATALMVLGPEEGLELALREDLAALFLVRDGQGFSEIMTPAFERLTRPRTTSAGSSPGSPAAR